MTGEGWRRLLRGLIALNGIAALAAAVVLAAAPAAIPKLAGLSAGADAAFLARLLAAAELAVAVLCLLSLRAGRPAAERIAGAVLVVLHAASALAEIGWAGHPVVAANILLRIALIAALLVAMRNGARVSRGRR